MNNIQKFDEFVNESYQDNMTKLKAMNTMDNILDLISPVVEGVEVILKLLTLKFGQAYRIAIKDRKASKKLGDAMYELQRLSVIYKDPDFDPETDLDRYTIDADMILHTLASEDVIALLLQPEYKGVAKEMVKLKPEITMLCNYLKSKK